MSGEYSCPKQISSESKDLLRGILNTDPAKRFTVEDIRKHVWYNQVKDLKPEGVIVGYNSVPIDRSVLTSLQEYGFNLE